MRSGLLLLLLFALPLFFAGSSTKGSKGGSSTNEEQSSGEDDPPAAPTKDSTCIPPIFVVLFFTAYGIFLIGLYIYGGKQWIGLMEAKFKLRKMMALEIALINYDAYCERHELHGRAELFVPALNDGFFLDPEVQEAWLSVNNLRQRIYKVPTSDYADIMRKNWDVIKIAMRRRKKKMENDLRNAKKNGEEVMPKLNLQSLCHQVLAADLFHPSTLLNKQTEDQAEGTDNQPGTSQAKEVDGSAEKNLMEPGRKDDEKKTDPSMEKKDKSEKKGGKKEEKKDKKTKTETTKEGKKDSASDPKVAKKAKKDKKEKNSEEKEMDKKDEKKEKKEMKGKSEMKREKTKTEEKKEEEKEVKKKIKGKQSASTKDAKEEK